MNTHTHHDPDPTPAHGTERPIDTMTNAWTWPQRTHHHTWTDVARLVARLDSQAIAAGHPATYGTLHLVTPEAPGDHARIERRGSSDRIPGGGILATDATNSHAMLTTRLELYRDLADADHDSARVYLLERGDR